MKTTSNDIHTITQSDKHHENLNNVKRCVVFWLYIEKLIQIRSRLLSIRKVTTKTKKTILIMFHCVLNSNYLHFFTCNVAGRNLPGHKGI